MTQIAVLIALGTIAVGVALAYLLRLLPSVRLQLVGLGVLAVVLPLSGVLASGWVMFSAHDTQILAVSTAAALSAVVVALLLARWILSPLDHLRTTSRQFASGDLTARAPQQGPIELSELGADFNAMAVSIERLFEARRELVAWASHDLRTPLACMQAMLEAVDDGLADAEDYLPALQDQVAALSRLVDDLFELARIDAGILTLHLEDAAIDGVVDMCVRSLTAEATTKGVSIQSRIEAPPPDVRCAPEKVERVLYNLLTNALRHTPADGSIAVVVQPNRDVVTIAVEDTGPGIDDETAGRMFERFWRGDSSRTGNGSGLGLAIARGLVEAQGGQIWSERRADGGARVAFTLPITAERA
jgi:signal transduction histidine kinase